MTVAPNKASSESNSNNLKKDDFPKTAPAAYPVFFRSYSRKTTSGKRENWSEVGERNLSGLKELGKLSEEALFGATVTIKKTYVNNNPYWKNNSTCGVCNHSYHYLTVCVELCLI